MRTGFDNDKYIELQAEHIRERVGQFGGKLYLEFGGKLFDDNHASRVLPGFEPDVKFRMLKSLAADVEVIIAINANHIEKNKARGDLGITYDEDVLRLVDLFRSNGMQVAAVVITQYAGQGAADVFRHRLTDLGIACKLHYPIEGYPHDVDLIVSDGGYGKNEYVETTRPLVVVTAPGPGSGKLATCLSQIYHEHKRGIEAGYAKFETFPVWNLPLSHPVNIAYEAATADLDDANIIDSFHLDAYGKTTVNYNRDVEAFPVVRALMTKILGQSPYQSPTDMGVNMVGFAISDDEACREASLMEISRRYFSACEQVKRTGTGSEQVDRLRSIMQKAGIDKNYSPRPLGRAHARAGHGGARRRHDLARRQRGHGKDLHAPGLRELAAHERAQVRRRHRHRARDHQRLCDRAHQQAQDPLPRQQEPAPAHRRDPDGALHHLGDERGRGPRARGAGAAARLRRVLLGDHLVHGRGGAAPPGHQRVLRAQVRAQQPVPQVAFARKEQLERGASSGASSLFALTLAWSWGTPPNNPGTRGPRWKEARGGRRRQARGGPAGRGGGRRCGTGSA